MWGLICSPTCNYITLHTSFIFFLIVVQFFSTGNFPCLQPVFQRLIIKYSEAMKGYRVLRDTADEIIRQRRIEASGKVLCMLFKVIVHAYKGVASLKIAQLLNNSSLDYIFYTIM